VSRTAEVEVDGRRLKLSNLDKVFYPEEGFTKGQVLDYYTRVAPAVLPHLRDRPLTLKRYPDGVEGNHFYEKECPSHRPDWVRTTRIPAGGRQINFCVIDDLPSLAWAVNLADLELHASLSVADRMESPTVLAFDLDPGPPADVVDCAEVALKVRDLFAHFELESFPKTSGSKGMQVYVPLNVETSYEVTKPYAHAVARLLEQQNPDQIVSSMKKELRSGKVFVDWSQNDRHKTTVCVYSLRARPKPTVSTPLDWAEVEAAVGSRDPGWLEFTADQVLERVADRGDLFKPVLELKQQLPSLSA
jgi:bifunctional non-homologous end joining protein LigD